MLAYQIPFLIFPEELDWRIWHQWNRARWK